MEYFDFFGLPRALTLDPEELERRYYALSRRLHPDANCRRYPREQRLSLDAAANLNDAYRTLKDPVSRAEYLLKQEGLPPGKLPPEALEEMFALSASVEAGEGRERVRELLAENRAELADRFREYDAEPSRATLVKVRVLLDRRRYLLPLAEQRP